MRRRLAWLVAVPLALAGSQVAHAVAYAAVYPEASLRVSALSRTGHSYLSLLPLVLGAGAAVVLVGLAAAVVDAARGRPVRDVPAAAFALLPPATFVVQELLELSLHTGSFGWHAFTAPTFLPGLALQLPFAVVAFVAARLLLRTAVELGRLLVPRERFVVRAAHVTPHLAAVRGRLAASGCSARAPPCAVVT
jgi:hypothetical protein